MLFRGEAPGEEWLEDVWMPCRLEQRSKGFKPIPQLPTLDGDTHGDAKGE